MKIQCLDATLHFLGCKVPGCNELFTTLSYRVYSLLVSGELGFKSLVFLKFAL